LKKRKKVCGSKKCLHLLTSGHWTVIDQSRDEKKANCGVDQFMPLLSICSTMPSRVDADVEGLNIYGNFP